jgi:methylmalonyl-CoA mutase
VVDLVLRGFKGPFAAADARNVHAAGGSEAQELAYALSSALAYLRAFEAGGMHLDAARRTIFFRFAADADQFLTIAKLRALRTLWARVEEACGLVPLPAFVSVETAWRIMTRRDPHVNLLRATSAAFSAAVGGADAIALLPFTAAAGLPDAFARRMARNTQLLLAEESNPPRSPTRRLARARSSISPANFVARLGRCSRRSRRLAALPVLRRASCWQKGSRRCGQSANGTWRTGATC